MNCKKCNNVIPEGTTICPFCGTSVGIKESEPLPMGNNINIPNSGPIKQMPSNNNSSPFIEPIKPMNNNLNTNYNNEPSKSKKPLIFLILGLLLIGIITFVIFRFVIPNSNTNEPSTPVEPDVVEETIIGSDELGYLALPGDWFEYETDEEVTALQYINDDGWIVSLESIDMIYEDITAQNLAAIDYAYLNNDVEKVEKIEIIEDKVADYDAYKVTHYKTDKQTWINEWYFEAGDKKIYYISLEGPSLESDYLTIPDTFSLTEIE